VRAPGSRFSETPSLQSAAARRLAPPHPRSARFPRRRAQLCRLRHTAHADAQLTRLRGAPVQLPAMGSVPNEYAEWVAAHGGSRPIRKILIANNGRACAAARRNRAAGGS